MKTKLIWLIAGNDLDAFELIGFMCGAFIIQYNNDNMGKYDGRRR